jgi:hypothetical protein
MPPKKKAHPNDHGTHFDNAGIFKVQNYSCHTEGQQAKRGGVCGVLF